MRPETTYQVKLIENSSGVKEAYLDAYRARYNSAVAQIRYVSGMAQPQGHHDEEPRGASVSFAQAASDVGGKALKAACDVGARALEAVQQSATVQRFSSWLQGDPGGSTQGMEIGMEVAAVVGALVLFCVMSLAMFTVSSVSDNREYRPSERAREVLGENTSLWSRIFGKSSPPQPSAAAGEACEEDEAERRANTWLRRLKTLTEEEAASSNVRIGPLGRAILTQGVSSESYALGPRGVASESYALGSSSVSSFPASVGGGAAKADAHGKEVGAASACQWTHMPDMEDAQSVGTVSMGGVGSYMGSLQGSMASVGRWREGHGLVHMPDMEKSDTLRLPGAGGMRAVSSEPAGGLEQEGMDVMRVLSNLSGVEEEMPDHSHATTFFGCQSTVADLDGRFTQHQSSWNGGDSDMMGSVSNNSGSASEESCMFQTESEVGKLLAKFRQKSSQREGVKSLASSHEIADDDDDDEDGMMVKVSTLGGHVRSKNEIMTGAGQELERALKKKHTDLLEAPDFD